MATRVVNPELAKLPSTEPRRVCATPMPGCCWTWRGLRRSMSRSVIKSSPRPGATRWRSWSFLADLTDGELAGGFGCPVR